MGQSIPGQHPAVVLRSHYMHLRALLASAMIAVVGLAVAVVILASGTDAGTGAGGRNVSAPTEFRLPSYASEHGGAPVPDPRFAQPSNGRRYDGGPDEGTRGIVAAPAPSTRYDGGPEEGSRGR